MNGHLYTIMFFSMILLAGCQQGAKNDQVLPVEDEDNRIMQVKDSDPKQNQDFDNKQIAIHLANIATNVPNVNNASAIVAGPYAVVGIDVDEDLDRSRVGTVKYSVSEALQHDPYGKTAVVVADADITARIRSMGEKISQGHPIKGIVDELSAIVGRYMPDFPINENQPQDPDQNKDLISDDEEERLEDIEEDQSEENQ